MTNIEIRTEIGKSLIGRCINCYDWITNEEQKYNSSNGKWVGPNFGPLCQTCFNHLMLELIRRLQTQ